MMDIDAFFKAIGILVVGAVIIAIPILCGLAFGFHWHSFIKIILVILCIIEYVIIISEEAG